MIFSPRLRYSLPTRFAPAGFVVFVLAAFLLLGASRVQAVCGNGVIDAGGEQCDQGGANGSSTSCCNSDCTFRASGQTCRIAAGDCDVAETCSGSSGACPFDNFHPSPVNHSNGGAAMQSSTNGGTADRAIDGNTDGDFVNGSVSRTNAEPEASWSVDLGSVQSINTAELWNTDDGSEGSLSSYYLFVSDTPFTGPTIDDSLNQAGVAAYYTPGQAARPSRIDVSRTGRYLRVQLAGSDALTLAEVRVLSGTVCREGADLCDADDLCEGFGPSCTSLDAKQAIECRGAAGTCDVAETCDGINDACSTNDFVTPGVECRMAADLCDVAETCTGSSAVCPSDAVAPPTTVCRPAVDQCDPAESCDGTNTACPANVPATDGDNDGSCDLIDNCLNDPNGDQADSDNDGPGDACDPCTNTGDSFASQHKIIFRKMLPPTGDDKLILKGAVVVPGTPTIDPLANGLRVILDTSIPGQVLDGTVSGGAYNQVTRTGWRVNAAGNRWTYKNGASSVSDPISVVKISASPVDPGMLAVKFTVKGKDGAFVATAPDLPIKGTVVFDQPHAQTGQCSELVFPSSSSCQFNGSVSALKCE